MTDLNEIFWYDDLDGYVAIGEYHLRTVGDIAHLVHGHEKMLSDAVLSGLGSVAYFFALRDFGRTAGARIVECGDKAIDSFYVVAQETNAQEQIESGIRLLLDHVVGERNIGFARLIENAFRFLIQQTQVVAKQME